MQSNQITHEVHLCGNLNLPTPRMILPRMVPFLPAWHKFVNLRVFRLKTSRCFKVLDSTWFHSLNFMGIPL